MRALRPRPVTFFREVHQDEKHRARAGELRFGDAAHGAVVETPVFMPVGTQGTVKAMWPEQLEEIGYRLILGNTYHLHLRPGDDRIARMGGLHRFMAWRGAILTDSGGFQAFSLSDRVKLLPDGVEFRSHIDGSLRMFTPESTLDIQRNLGSNIMMVLDDCPPAGADKARLEAALFRTHAWAARSIAYRDRLEAAGQWSPRDAHLFGIVQGGTDPALRAQSVESVAAYSFSGIALGGLSVGETRESFHETLAHVGPLLDARPRYLMGVGTVPDMLEAVRHGIDMFDCVLPTRNARNGQFLTQQGRVNIRNAVHAEQSEPVDPACDCRVCRRFSRGYLRHLFVAREMLGPQLATYHNLHFMHTFTRSMRQAILADDFSGFYERWQKVEGPP